MSAQLLLKCGCPVTFRESVTPRCPTHGVQPVVRALGMPRPRIRGTASGPCVETQDLAPASGRLVDAPDTLYGSKES